MAELDDQRLLAQFSRQNSEAAFSELVRRYINLVYSVAIRQTRNPHQAEEITQAVFIVLARKAARLAPRVILSGWLYQTARLTAANFLRGERRRARREQEATMESFVQNSSSDETWSLLAPLLDSAMGELGQKEREALVLRFFEGRSLSEVGLRLGVSEDAAKMRVSRGLEKLRQLFAKRGVAVPAAALGAALGANAVEAAPPTLAAAIPTLALKAALATASTIGLVKTTLETMSLIKFKAVAATLVVIAGVATPLAFQQHSINSLRSQNSLLEQRNRELQERGAETQRLAQGQAEQEEIKQLRAHENELLRLRGEVTRLRQQQTQANQMAAENQRLRQALAKGAEAESTGESDPFRVETIQRLNLGKQTAVAFLMFAQDNAESLPQDLGQAKAYFGGATNVLASAQDTFEITSTGKLAAITNAAQTVLLREKEPRRSPQGSWCRVYVFADGHSEVLASPDGDYAGLEQKRGFLALGP